MSLLLSCLVSLQDFLGFVPSREAAAAVQDSLHKQAEQQQQWALSQLQNAAMLTQRRCCRMPLYGQDLRKVSPCYTSLTQQLLPSQRSVFQ